MFKGIVAKTCRVHSVNPRDQLIQVGVELCPSLSSNLEIGASVALDGVCLTVTALEKGCAFFDVVQETLHRTTLGALCQGRMINVERSACFGDEIGGHILSGHVLGVAEIAHIAVEGANRLYTFTCPPEWMRYILVKGYIALDGASLTVVDRCSSGRFSVAIIPETHRRTTFGFKSEGDEVNVEIDPWTHLIVETIERVLCSHSQQQENIPPNLPRQEL